MKICILSYEQIKKCCEPYKIQLQPCRRQKLLPKNEVHLRHHPLRRQMHMVLEFHRSELLCVLEHRMLVLDGQPRQQTKTPMSQQGQTFSI